MTNFSMNFLLKPLAITVLAAATLFLAKPSDAQQVPERITGPIDTGNRITLPGMSPSMVIKNNDLGELPASTPVQGMTLLFNRTAAQQADLDALVAAQQDVNSPLYHKWMSPEEFGARFGMAPADIAKVTSWLQQKGFTIDRVARANNFIVFSGNAGLIASVFNAPIHNYRLPDGSIHFAPSAHPTLPAALASTVGYIRGLNSFRKHTHLTHAKHPKWTNINDPHTPYLLTPVDLATQYDINAAYKAGYTGAGQSIVVVGVSEIVPSDITTFQSLVGATTAKAPIQVLVPSSGPPAFSSGDESESDLDLEYTSTIAKGAQVYFVYTGANYNNGTDDAEQMAIDEKIAPVITTSYGDCEYYIYEIVEDGSNAYFTAQDAIYQQGVAQGQSLINAAGDDGSVDCIEDFGYNALGQAPAVDYPASSPYQTSMGATGFPQLTFNPSLSGNTVSTYWAKNTTGGAPLVNSLLKPVPETVWNDDDPYFGTSAGGGGVSLYEVGPTWQAPGLLIGGTYPIPTPPTTIKSGKNQVVPRVVPDIALFGSDESPGMLECSSDPGDFYPGQTNTCANGFYDSSGQYLDIAGGTSFDAPMFAGMLAIINQALNATGQGLANTTLYSIAQSATSYPLAFHDITVGSNSCYDYTANDANYGISGEPVPPAPMPAVCGVTSLTAGPSPPAEWGAVAGYDYASGLGTIDLNNLISAWPKTPASSLTATIMTSSAAASNPPLSTADVITFTVAPAAATGTVTVLVDGVSSATPTLTSGVATYSFSSLILGTHVICGNYGGDSTHGPSSSCAVLSVGNTTGTSGVSFSLAATPASSTSGSTGTSTVTVTAGSNYNGTVGFTFTAPQALVNVCITTSAANVSLTSGGKGSVTVSLVPDVASTSCTTGTFLAKHGLNQAISTPVRKSPWKNAPLPLTAASLLLLVCVRRRSSLVRSGVTLAFVMTLSLAGLGITGCSSSSSAASSTPTPTQPTNPNPTPAGAYVITVTGTDAGNATITNTATFTYTVQ